MAAIAAPRSLVAAVTAVGQRMVLLGVSWKDHVSLRDALGTPGLRVTYCEGALEFMTPSRAHELNKKTIARLVEHEAKERSAEPDQCYRVGSILKEGEFPDIVLEVIHTNPILDKLHVYKGFGVPEVWLFRNGAFELYRLANDAYEPIERSGFLPDLDFALIARLAVREDQHEALRELRRML